MVQTWGVGSGDRSNGLADSFATQLAAISIKLEVLATLKEDIAALAKMLGYEQTTKTRNTGKEDGEQMTEEQPPNKAVDNMEEHGGEQITGEKKPSSMSSDPNSYFQKDAEVEISTNNSGFRGTWDSRTVVKPKNSTTGNNTQMMVVEYRTLMADESGTKPLRATIDVVQWRPLPPREKRDRDFEFGDFLIEMVDSNPVRPWPPDEALDHSRLLEEVAAWYNDGWCGEEGERGAGVQGVGIRLGMTKRGYLRQWGKMNCPRRWLSPEFPISSERRLLMGGRAQRLVREIVGGKSRCDKGDERGSNTLIFNRIKRDLWGWIMPTCFDYWIFILGLLFLDHSYQLGQIKLGLYLSNNLMGPFLGLDHLMFSLLAIYVFWTSTLLRMG